jgi:hypothetical protein
MPDGEASGYGSPAQEVDDDGNDRENQQNVDHSSGDMKRNKTEQPHHQQNQPNQS